MNLLTVDGLNLKKVLKILSV